MDALFVVVAELLIVPLILWGLIVLELTVGVAGSILAIIKGRRSPTEAAMHTWRSVRRRLLWSLIFLSSGLLLADLVFFDTLVTLALGSADDREDLDVSFSHADGSFILGRIELHQLTMSGVRGGDDPSASFEFQVDSLVIDVDTKALLTANFAVEEIAIEGVLGNFARLRASDPKPKPDQRGIELSREFSVDRLHFADVQVTLHDQATDHPRELGFELRELDLGPVHSNTAVFDLLYRARGHGSVAGHAFTLTAVTQAGIPQTTLELRDIPLEALADPLEQAAGIRAKGHADVEITNRYIEATDPQIDLAIELQLKNLELTPGEKTSMGTQLMLEMATRALTQLGDKFPLEFALTISRSELEGLRSFTESGIMERAADGIAKALRDKLQADDPPN
ncbi:hypothetical protein DB30_06881 [Enhygromyxa salina]|uniref:Uncharacterized protein n=1 Tax=Enhygromyxa salina TaxID=215803 RepID=A0A0C1Z9N7_9BACT|nr:DUF748 domain-containing protein [Enhygromyxa salina]KIG14279.1 hypothetical protein DB30_06881 [Enhygromyxa salina]